MHISNVEHFFYHDAYLYRNISSIRFSNLQELSTFNA